MPYGTDSRLNGFQAINCLATIIQSLRDKGAPRRCAPSPFRFSPGFSLAGCQVRVVRFLLCRLRQEPGPPLTLVDPILDQAGGGNVVVPVTNLMRGTQKPSQLQIVGGQLA